VIANQICRYLIGAIGTTGVAIEILHASLTNLVPHSGELIVARNPFTLWVFQPPQEPYKVPHQEGKPGDHLQHIEQQHQELQALFERMEQSIQQGSGGEALDLLFQETLTYLVYHQRSEERLLRQLGYPQLDGHKMEHRRLLKEGHRLYQQFQENQGSRTAIHNLQHKLQQLYRHHNDKDELAFLSSQPPSPVIPTTRTIENNRILVLDDEPKVLEYYKTILTGDHQQEELNELDSLMRDTVDPSEPTIDQFDVTYCSQGKEGYLKAALAIAEERPYAVAFIDMRMPPGWDGLKTAIKLRELDSEIRIVFVTAYHDNNLQQLNQAIPTNMLFLSKPMHEEEVYQIAHTHCVSWDQAYRRKSAEEELNRFARRLDHQATHDALTGVYNRRAFFREMDEMIQDRTCTLFMLYLDLDQFKVINDTVGHIAGDEVLIEVSSRIGITLNDNEMLARLGGDEFGILLRDRDLESVENLCKQLLTEISNYVLQAEGLEFKINSSIGVTSFGKGRLVTRNEILREADIACYQAKEKGLSRYHIYHHSDEELQQRNEELQTVGLVNQALQDGRLQLYAQPIIPVTKDADEGPHRNHLHFEVLIRLINLDGKVISPGVFIPACERYHLMPIVDRWVIKETFRYISTLRCSGDSQHKQVIVGINLSGSTVMDEELAPYIVEQQKQFNIDPQQVYFEVTETTAITRMESAKHFLYEMRSYGFSFALDDFGSGMSSFSYLKNLPVDLLKIDGQFIKGLVSSQIDRAMVESIQSVSEVMEMSSIAEFVENQETHDELEKIGVDFAQGYLHSEPKPIAEMIGAACSSTKH